MKTVTIQIGNSDDKLTQRQWSEYVNEVWAAIKANSTEIHFSGGSSNWEPWQNFAWVVMGDDRQLSALRSYLPRVAAFYNQESIAWTEGGTEFIQKAATPDDG